MKRKSKLYDAIRASRVDDQVVKENSMETLATINVIELIDGKVERLTAFPRSWEAEEEAERLFVKLCREHGLSEAEHINAVEAGVYVQGTWSAMIQYSTACG